VSDNVDGEVILQRPATVGVVRGAVCIAMRTSRVIRGMLEGCARYKFAHS
jgi:hypothetical protein